MNRIIQTAARALAVLLIMAAAPPSLAVEHRVASAAEIARLTEEARPGDIFVMASGAWKDEVIVLRGQGTAEKPITFRAETPGAVVLSGRSSVVIDGEHLVVSGLLLTNGQLTGDGLKLGGRHCRLTDSAITGGRYKFYVHLFGVSNRVDHCYLADKTNDSPTLQVEAEGRPNGHRIDHNHFGPRPPLGRNGGETIRVGYSGQSMSSSATRVEQNLFDRCDGEIEIISSKSCDNVYRGNTFLDCAGMLTLRHGNRCRVEANFFIGHHKRGSGGIRVIGEDHVVINNYIEGVRQGGFWITAGISNSPLVGYFQARNCLIAFNTMVDSPGPCLVVDAGFGTSGRTLRPDHITIANNLLLPTDGVVWKGEASPTFTWIGNLTESSNNVPAHPGLHAASVPMTREGLWRPGTDSAVRGKAEGKFPIVDTDIDGQPRREPFDVGADQWSEAPIVNRPLRASEVGPSWMTP